MNDAINQEESGQDERPQSREDKFFGVQTTVTRPSREKARKAAEEEGTSNVEIEGEEETKTEQRSEVEEYSKNVQKRIDELTYKAREAERQRDAIAMERDEAFRVTQTLHGRTQEYERIIASGEAELVSRVKKAAEADVANAKSEYRKAYEEGDTEQVVAAQEKLINAQAEMNNAKAYEADYNARLEAYQSQFQQPQQVNPGVQQDYQQPPQQQPRPQVKRPDPETEDWAAKNPWFMDPKHRDMSAVALATHETLITEHGVKPNTPEYFSEIDKVVRKRFPEYFEGTGQSSPSSSRRSPVAPATRNTGGKSRKVKLTASQVALAKKLGITPDQYAAELLKGQGQ